MKKYIDQGKKDTRSGFGSGLAAVGKRNENVVALCADLVGSLKMDEFIANNPERFFPNGNYRSKYDGSCCRYDNWWQNSFYRNIC
jgi:hypothetical protein